MKPASPFDVSARLKAIDRFFAGKDPVHTTMRQLAKRLDRAKIPYAIAGGMAVNAHRYHRTTGDVDFLLTPEGFAAFRGRFVGKFYDPAPGRSKRFIDRANGVTIDILVSGGYPGSGRPGPVAYPDPEGVAQEIGDFRFVDLPTLVTLKLAARRHRDFGDVVELIRCNELDESFLGKIPPSLHRDFVECLDEKRREDDYIAREG